MNMKFALFDVASGAVLQWQDDEQFDYSPPLQGQQRLALAADCEVPATPRWVVDGQLTDVAPVVAPALPTHAELVELALKQARKERQPILSVLDGLQVSAVVNGYSNMALLIETAKQSLRDITALDLSVCVTYEDMRLAFKARYAELVADAPQVAIAFAEVVA
jgi:hypothetical protein